jgi:hypothetical protein
MGKSMLSVLDLVDGGCYFLQMLAPLEKIPDVRDGLTREERVVQTLASPLSGYSCTPVVLRVTLLNAMR